MVAVLGVVERSGSRAPDKKGSKLAQSLLHASFRSPMIVERDAHDARAEMDIQLSHLFNNSSVAGAGAGASARVTGATMTGGGVHVPPVQQSAAPVLGQTITLSGGTCITFAAIGCDLVR